MPDRAPALTETSNGQGLLIVVPAAEGTDERAGIAAVEAEDASGFRAVRTVDGTAELASLKVTGRIHVLVINLCVRTRERVAGKRAFQRGEASKVTRELVGREVRGQGLQDRWR